MFFTYILMPHNMIILYFQLSYFAFSNSALLFTYYSCTHILHKRSVTCWVRSIFHYVTACPEDSISWRFEIVSSAAPRQRYFSFNFFHHKCAHSHLTCQGNGTCWWRSCHLDIGGFKYRQVSNIRHTKSQHLKYSRSVLRLSLPNPLKPDVKSGMTM